MRFGSLQKDRFTSLCFGKSGKRGQEERISGEELEDFLSATEALNRRYNAEIITEFPFNALGILEKVTSTKVTTAQFRTAANPPSFSFVSL